MRTINVFLLYINLPANIVFKTEKALLTIKGRDLSGNFLINCCNNLSTLFWDGKFSLSTFSFFVFVDMSTISV